VLLLYNRWYAVPEGGGLMAEGRAKREQVRFEVAEMFAAGVTPTKVARRLRVALQSANAWHRAWLLTGGRSALASKDPEGSPCRLEWPGWCAGGPGSAPG
jgi:putative transposase